MKALYFDCFAGISGDMTLGALIDLGIDKNVFINELKKLNLGGYDIVIEKKMCKGISCTDVQVIVNEDYEKTMERMTREGHFKDQHSHEHHHGHHHCEHNNENHSQKGHSHGRNLCSIEALIDSSSLKQNVKDFSKKVFREIARAEAKVHNKHINEIHFHEVGAVDSIVDIVGTGICIDLLGVKSIFASPLHDGQGFIECAHGTLPVPVPAVLEILSNTHIPVIIENVNTELITPTGAGLIKCLARNFGSMPVMMIEKTGYGMGKRETGRFNALRVVMGELLGEDSLLEEIAMLETNIDDTSPEILGFVMEKLFENGALDVFYTPIFMKKNRPAVKMTVLSHKDSVEKILDIIFRETSTIGVRKIDMKRYCMDRETLKIGTQYGEVRVKVSSAGQIKKCSPEYEDCKEIAEKHGIPLINVYDIVNRQAKDLI
jgi:hypothetical protein